MDGSAPIKPRKIVERVTQLDDSEIYDLCEASDMAILDGGGFGWLKPPAREALERYWRGVLLVPERELFVTRLNGIICGSGQLVNPPRNNEAQRHSAWVQSAFLAPWSRGHGLARDLILALEARARARKFKVLNLDIRETQDRAIRLYENLEFELWGTHPAYARVRGKTIKGLFFYKDLTATKLPKAE